MFIHAVLFQILPKEVPLYRKDSLMWARHAKRHKGFVAYFTMQRQGYKNQFASVYEWKTEKDHKRFMDKCHDWLVGKSRAKVKVLGYYNLKEIDNLRHISS
jgi:hypothetical protein